MVDDQNQFASSKHDWFEYAYYSSAATLGDSDETSVKTRPLKLQ